MDSRSTNRGDKPLVADTPEDVAVLYSWANLHGAKYRDFSASRREYRAQIRLRAAETLRQRELLAQADAEAAAAAAERAAIAAETAARSQNASDSQILRLQSLRKAEAAARRAAAERVEATRRAEAAAIAAEAALREEREIAEAHASARRQAQNYAESEARRRELAGPQPSASVPGEMGDPYVASTLAASDTSRDRANAARDIFAHDEYRSQEENDERARPEDGITRLSLLDAPRRRPQGYHPDESSGVWLVKRPSALEASTRNTPLLVPVHEAPLAEPIVEPVAYVEPVTYVPTPIAVEMTDPYLEPTAELVDTSLPTLTSAHFDAPVDPAPNFNMEAPLDPMPDQPPVAVVAVAPVETIAPVPVAVDNAGPAWLYESPRPAPPPSPSAPKSFGGDTLQDSRERVAARWYALKGVFGNTGPELPALQPVRQSDSPTTTPILAVFSLAGGVGKTSLVATLGRALSSKGEKVLLTDTTSHGLLPFYFGARELRPGVVRTFSPPSGSTDAPIHLVSYDVEQTAGSATAQDQMIEEVTSTTRGNHRVVLDLSSGSSWVLRRMANLHPTVLVPMAPDMNSVISLQAVERFFQSVTDSEGRALQPFYVLNQFDASLPLHLDVREVFRRQLGERLLRFVIHRSPAVSEALAEGMTVVDYAPDAQVSQDYFEVASWLRSTSPAATAGVRNVRWSER